MLAMPSWKGRLAPATKQELHLFVHELTGIPAGGQGPDRTLTVQVEWKGNGPRAGIPLRAIKKSHTAARAAGDDGIVRWEEGFRHTCKLRAAAAAGNRKFKSWIINLAIQGYGFHPGGHEVIGKAKLDAATYAREKGQSMTIPLWCFVGGEATQARLTVTLEFFEAGRKDEKAPTALRLLGLRSFSRTHQRSGSETSSGSVFSSSHVTSSSDLSSSGEYAAANRSKPGHRRLSSESQHRGPAPALLRALSWSNLSSSFRKTVGPTKPKPPHGPTSSKTEGSNGLHHAAASTAQSDVRVRVPQEDRLQSLLQQEQDIPAGMIAANDLMASETETAESTHRGNWERRTIRSRDGRMELTTDVFFASIDQRNEAAAGEGACAVLVTVIADWLHSNMGRLPDQPQFDELVRQGSSEWRRLCEDVSHRERFADAHFDLETVLEARVRPVMAVTDMSIVGFFRPPGDGAGSPDYLLETVPFEFVWDEATRVGVGEERTYVVGWNDHFFVLKATPDQVYIIDTLGERLFEGCDRAYILRFDKNSLIRTVPQVATTEVKEETEEPGEGVAQVVEEEEKEQAAAGQVLFEGMVAGREFIKEFLAAVPLRELQEEMMMRGAVSPDSHLLQRMQIEFHYTISL